VSSALHPEHGQSEHDRSEQSLHGPTTAAGHDREGLPISSPESPVENRPGHQAGTELEQRFPDPGLPAHVHRRGDTDPKAAKRAERQVAALFGLSTLGTIAFLVGFFVIKLDGGIDDATWSTIWLGLALAVSLFFIGAGAIHWAKTLMPDDEVVEERHPMRSTDEQRRDVVAMLAEGGEATGFGRRKMIWGSMLGAMGAVALTPLVLLRDLGPLPHDKLRHTEWGEGVHLVTDPTGMRIKPAAVAIGGVLHVLPEEKKEEGGEEENAAPGETEGSAEGESHPIENLNERAKAAVLLIRLEPGLIDERSDPRGWSVDGIVAYSKICTHVGCPVGLYEQETHHLLCPCHQSTFDVLDNCNVIFGPAARPLPQLALALDEEGYLVAKHDFTEAVGPSFWERGNDVTEASPAPGELR
jgi:ubiquinol-cytochrome c reductase iron-sulfur subunit